MPDVMRLIQQALRRWAPHIERATVSTVRIEPMSSGEFAVMASWVATAKTSAGSHRILFTRDKVLGPSARRPTLQQRPIKKACRFADEVIREILQARGI